MSRVSLRLGRNRKIMSKILSDVVTKTKVKLSPSLKDLISFYELSNKAEGKSPKTIEGYNEILRSFLSYLRKELQC